MSFTVQFFAVLLLFASTAQSEICKCRPSEACWPSENDWATLNNSISGRLIRAVPPASVCHRSHPTYNALACKTIFKQWFNSAFHAADPISIGAPAWAGNSCPPIYENGTSITGDPTAGSRGCTIGKHPAYVVNATEAGHVQAAVNFAKKKNLRLVIKNTGHSYIGRSTAFGSFSIWTHYMKNIKYHTDFQPQQCVLNSTLPQMAATLGAGVQDYEMYEEMDKYNAAIVGGANPTVGVVGWFTSGGHGPLSSSYGMGADNVLEATILLPIGEIVTANSCQHPDLFFAIRGGGGSTYGIVLSVVMKAYPTPHTTHHTFIMSSKTKYLSPKFWDLAAFVLSEMPRLKAGGMQGYFGLRSFGWGSGDRVLSMNWGFYLYNKPNGTADTLFKPIKQRLDRENASISYFTYVSPVPSFFQQYKKQPGWEPVAGGGGSMGGWLLPESALTNLTKLSKALEIVGPTVDGPAGTHITGHFSSPNGNVDLDVGMNPAWRDSVIDLIPWEPYEEGASQAVIDATAKRMTTVKMKALRDLAPASGAYLNECDTNEPDWRRAFFGRNYDRLLAVKRRYDPDDLLWCRNCVGNDRWEEQSDGVLCKV